MRPPSSSGGDPGRQGSPPIVSQAIAQSAVIVLVLALFALLAQSLGPWSQGFDSVKAGVIPGGADNPFSSQQSETGPASAGTTSRSTALSGTLPSTVPFNSSAANTSPPPESFSPSSTDSSSENTFNGALDRAITPRLAAPSATPSPSPWEPHPEMSAPPPAPSASRPVPSATPPAPSAPRPVPSAPRPSPQHLEPGTTSTVLAAPSALCLEYEQRRQLAATFSGEGGDHSVPIFEMELEGENDTGLCLDGSPPAYHFSPGWGSGQRRWILYLEGGGWCYSSEECARRAGTRLGSSHAMERTYAFSGILSNSSRNNPFFYDWNVVLLRYCSGASFSGTASEANPKASVHFDGWDVFTKVVHHLLRTRGMINASDILLGGASAGGLGALLLCDQFAEMVKSLAPSGRQEESLEDVPAMVKCLSDGGFILDTHDTFGKEAFRPYFASLVYTHRPHLSVGCLHGLNINADSTDPSCFFPENFLRFTVTPFFVINSLYDRNIIKGSYLPQNHPYWVKCLADLHRCTPGQFDFFDMYRVETISKVNRVLRTDADSASAPASAQGETKLGPGHRAANGAFLYSCYVHAEAYHSQTWHGPTVPRLEGKSMAEAVALWFFGCSEAEALSDCKLPCNGACPM